jgi:DNA-binding beta-propeller fold protein YncE
VAAAFAVAAIGAPAATAAPGSLSFQQTFSPFQLNNASDTVVSPDGKHVYATAFASGDGSVIAASRNPTTGELTLIDDYLEVDPEIEGIGGAEAIAISPDGKHVYVAGYDTDSIAMFERNATSGALNMTEAYFDGEGGVTHLGGAMDVAVSPDGATVYAAGFDDDGLTVFGRNQSTGELGLLDAEIDGVGMTDGLNEIRAVAVAPDGENVYTVGQQDSDVTTFTRQPGTGVLAWLETDSNGDATLGAFELAVSPDNANVYVVANAGNAVSEWDRSAADGRLVQGGSIEDGVQTPDLTDPHSVVVSGDGGQVYVASDGDDALLTLDRAAGGALSFRETAKDGQNGINGLAGADGLSLAPDGTSLYAAGSVDDDLAVFKRELPPVVQPPGGGGGKELGLDVRAKKKQKAGKLAITVECALACDVVAKAKGKAGGAKIKSKRAKDSLAAATADKLKLKLTKGSLRKTKGERGKLSIKVQATAGNASETETVKVKLKG